MEQYNKYPRTPHLPWSDGPARDDDVLIDTRHFEGQEVVVTKKYDGENTSIYPSGYTHARSVDGKFHPSQSWIKSFAASIAWQIPEECKLIGEYMYAKHSIEYTDLPSYFLLFAVVGPEYPILGAPLFWGWDDTVNLAQELGLEMPETLYRGAWDASKIKQLPLDLSKDEGYVVRFTNCFYVSRFKQSVAKYVRPNHVQTEKHWSQTWTTNKVR